LVEIIFVLDAPFSEGADLFDSFRPVGLGWKIF
jgi:hypothetical protein